MKPRSNRFRLAASPLFLLAIVALFTIAESVSAELMSLVGSRPLVTRTWDGGGVTNNWSDGANWSGDVAPGAGDAVVFDGTSTKDGSVDVDFSISSLQIIAGYTGTITQGNSNLTIGGIYEQLSGTYIAGNGVLSIASTFTLNGGSFTAPTGTLSFPAAVTVASGTTFNPNGGTVAFVGVGAQSLSIPDGFALNAVILNKTNNTGLFLSTPSTLTVNGTLSLTEGTIHRNSFGTVDARGDVLIAPSFDNNSPGNVPAFLTITGPAVRTVTFPVGAGMLPLTVNAPNTTLNFSGSGTFTFPQNVDVQAASFSNGDVNVVADSHFTTNGFTQGSGSLTFNFDFTQTGGTFAVGSGSLTFNSNFTVSAGTFNAPAGILNFPRRVTVSAGAVFNHNNGTVVFNGPVLQDFFVPPGAVFPLNNLIVNKAHASSLRIASNGTVTVLGTLTLTEGGMDLNSGGTKVDIQGDLIMAPTFDGGAAGSPITLQLSGPATRTVSFPVGAVMLPLIVNAPNVTVNTSGTGTFTFSSVDLQSAASFTNGSVNTVMNGPVNLASAIFTQGSGDLTFLSSYTQTAGTFTAGTGALDFNAPYALNGGTFTAPSGTVSLGGEVRFLPAGTFNPNGGTVVFDGISAGQALLIPTTFTLNNVTVNRAHNTSLFLFNSPTTLVVGGTLQLIDGRLEKNSTGSFDAQGDVIVGPNFDGGLITNFRFTGSANQTFTNNGGVNPGATFWRIDKAPTAIVTAATSLELTSGQQLFIDSGTLYLNQNSNLTTSNLFIVGTAGKLINDSATTITLGGNVSQLGVIDLNGGGAACPDADTILIRSTNATPRSWDGAGFLKLIDVDMQNMSRVGARTVFSGTNSGGNSANWIFDGNCPSNVSISPGVAGVPAGDVQIFAAGGGVAPYTFSLPTNNSGATIEAVTGRYTAGPTMGVADTVRVTDAFGSTADATVNVVGTAVKLGFIVQPSNTVSGQTIAPSVKVACQDANGNTVTTLSVFITVSIANNPAGGTLSGTLTQQAVSGVATFDNLSIDHLGTGYTLQATHIGLQTGTSAPFNISVAIGPPVKLGFIVQPSDTAANSTITPPVQVAVQDVNGNTVPTATNSITVSIGNNPSGGTLFGTVPRNAVNGVASFDDLQIDLPGQGYTLTGAATGLTGDTSAAFDISAQPFVVSTTLPSGAGSLRQAIIDANTRPGPDTINFNIPFAVPILIGIGNTPLPVITDSIILDATTQPGFAGTPVIELSGGSFTGLDITAGNSTVRGLSLPDFFDAIKLRTNGGNVIQNNYIGPCITCGGGPGNDGAGIRIEDSSNNLIGGSTVGSRNVISGNARAGIEIVPFGAAGPSNDNRIQGNYIGTTPDGTGPHGNGEGAIVVAGSRNIIGGPGPNEGNRIAFNLGSFSPGVFIETGTGNSIRGNSIFTNTGEGIGLRNFDRAINNDFCDFDPGVNKFQNTPVVTGAVFSASSVLITGTLNSAPNQTYSVDFYVNSAGDPSGFGEGETFIGSTTVAIPSSCESSFSVTLPVSVTPGQVVTGTATDFEGNTSQFSAVAPVTATSTEVINTNDSGLGSLRQAIMNANATSGSQLISFNIPGSAPFDIVLATALPTITDPVVLDATTQPGYAGTPLIRLSQTSSTNVRDGLNIVAGQSTVRGFAIYGFPDHAIRIIAAGGNSIQGNYIGVDPFLNVLSGNGIGILILNSANNVVGGVASNSGNVIAQNGTGVEIRGTNQPDLATGNLIQGNQIGEGSGGPINGNFTGVRLSFTGGNTVGGTGAGMRNVISGNSSAGIEIKGSAVVCTPACTLTGNVVQGNLIGTRPDGTSQNGNSVGIIIDDGEKNLVGGTASGAGNKIAFNTSGGIVVVVGNTTSSRNSIRRNSIFSNGSLGIDLGGNGVTFNDVPFDSDNGANTLQNFPVLFSAVSAGGNTTIEGVLNSAPSTTFTLDFFSSTVPGSSGHGQGEIFLGSADVTTDAGGFGAFTSSSAISLPVAVPNGRFITATATDANGNTSEFSQINFVSARYQISGRVTDGAVPMARVRVELTSATETRRAFTTTAGNYSFSLLPPGNYSLSVVHPSITFTPATRTYTNLSQDQTNQNFDTFVRNFTVRGQARTIATGSTLFGPEGKASVMPPVPAGGFPLLGVNFHVVGPGINANVTNDRFGNYRFEALPPATYVLTPTKPNYTFNPPFANITVGTDETVDFDGTSLELSTLSGRIVYDSLGGIKAMNADGSGLVTLSLNSLRSAARIFPRFAENGQRIVFLSRSTTSAESKIFDMSADGTGRTLLYEENARLLSPVYSPDGSRVAFSNSTANLVIMNSDGSNVQSIIGNCTEPDWSPDATQIVCLENSNSTTTRVKTVNVSTTMETILDNTSGRKFSPRWSPDGTKIAFIRRQSGTPATHSIVVRHLLGGTDNFMTGTNNLFTTLSWSPDGARLLFTRDSIASVNSLRPPGGNKQLVTIQSTDGQNMLVIVNSFDGDRVDWGVSNSFATPASPTPTVITSGAVSINFPSTTGTGGFTTITPIEPNSAGAAPNGFVIGNFAFEINTTAGFTPPITICVDLDDPDVQPRPLRAIGTPALMHNENGVLVNITTSYDDTTMIICGQANSFSPFVVAEQIDSNLPSITGLVIDSNGDPMSGVAVNLTGAETDLTQTDSNGLFTFVNLNDGANYNVQPQSVGHLFTEYSQNLLAVTGENTVVFTGTASAYQIAGRVANPLGVGIGGVTVTLDGAATDEVTTDASGNYLFTGLPADGAYFVVASSAGLSISPSEHSIGALTSDASGIDFTGFAPTAASVSVGGRVLNAGGQGISKARVSIAGTDGNIRTALTNGFGYYRFDQVEIGGVYILTVEAKQYQFANPTRSISVVDELTDVDFIALPRELALTLFLEPKVRPLFSQGHRPWNIRYEFQKHQRSVVLRRVAA